MIYVDSCEFSCYSMLCKRERDNETDLWYEPSGYFQDFICSNPEMLTTVSDAIVEILRIRKGIGYLLRAIISLSLYSLKDGRTGLFAWLD